MTRTKLIASHADLVNDRAKDSACETEPFKFDLLYLKDAGQTLESMRGD
jgi:hypothetical protein